MKNFKAFLRDFIYLFFILSLFCFKVAKAYEDSTTITSSPYLYIPDGPGEDECGYEVESYNNTLAPDDAIVLSVDIFFAVSHNWPRDLVVVFQYDDDTMHYEVLWSYGSVHGSTFSTTEDWSFFGLKANANWKLKIRDCDQGITGTLDTWTLKVRYHIPPDPPAFVWASTGTGQREINVNWTPVLDTQCVSYKIEWNRNRNLLYYDNIIEGDASVLDCDYTSKTINFLKCVDYYYLRMRTVSMYGAISKPSWPLAGALSSYCQNVIVSGSLEYVNYDDQYAGYSSYPDIVPIEYVPVTIWSASGDSFAVPPIYTGNFGLFSTTLALVTEPIYIKFHLIDQDNYIGVFNYDNGSLISTVSNTLGPENSFDVIKDENSPEEHDTMFARASYSFDYLQRTKYFFQSLPPAPWDTPPVRVFYDYDNNYDFAVSNFDSLHQVYWMRLTSRVDPDAFQYRRCAPVHEYAHLIHLKAWDIKTLYRPECTEIHYPDSPTTGYCALVEGWAELLSCVPYSLSSERKAWYLKYNNRNLEDNDWWSGPDGKNVDGSIVEGAVASAWYDMEDLNIDYPDERSNTEYYDLEYELGKIFDIFKTNKPQNMIEFMRYWQSYPGLENWEKERLIKIFAQHHIVLPVSGDVNSDGKVSLSDIVYLINYLFKFGPGFEPFWKGDTNGDCKVSVSDIVYLIGYLFKSGPAPVCDDSCWTCS